MNESRLAHPRGFDGRFLVIRSWAVRAVRLEGAAILGLLDYLDGAGIKQVGRKRLLAELDGIAGKGLVDSALERLLSLGWIEKIAVRLVGDSNRTVAHEFRLCADEINNYLGNPHGYLASRNRNAPTSEIIHKRVPISDSISDPKSERPIEENNNQKKQQQGPVVAFFGEIEGQAMPLADARELLARDLGQASEEQARWAALAWAHAMSRRNVGNPVGLARRLAKMAAAGEVSPPAAAVQAAREESQAAAAAAGEAARQAALRASAEAVMRDIRAGGVSGGGRGKGSLMDILRPHPPAP